MEETLVPLLRVQGVVDNARLGYRSSYPPYLPRIGDKPEISTISTPYLISDKRGRLTADIALLTVEQYVQSASRQDTVGCLPG